MLTVGDMVKHKTSKILMRGTIKNIANSGERARVAWESKDNPEISFTLYAYYRLDLLEKIEEVVS